jgi:hypothetical protein
MLNCVHGRPLAIVAVVAFVAGAGVAASACASRSKSRCYDFCTDEDFDATALAVVDATEPFPPREPRPPPVFDAEPPFVRCRVNDAGEAVSLDDGGDADAGDAKAVCAAPAPVCALPDTLAVFRDGVCVGGSCQYARSLVECWEGCESSGDAGGRCVARSDQ